MSVRPLDKRRGTIGVRRAGRRRLAAAAATAMSVGGGCLASSPSSARGATYVWQYNYNFVNSGFSDTDASYHNSSNWVNQSSGASDGVPGVNDSAVIGDGSTAYIYPGDLLATGSVYVGYNFNGSSNGYVNQSGGTFNVSAYLGIGYDGSPDGQSSEYDISAGTLNTTGSFIQLLGSAAVTDSAVMRIGGTAIVNAVGTDNGAGGGASVTVGDLGGNGHLYLSNTATLNTKYLLYVGVGSASSVYSIGVMDMSGGTLNMGSGLRVGAFGATGTLNLTGGTVTQSNASSPSYLAYQNGTGTWNISGSTTVVTLADELRVGGSDSSGTYTGTGYLNVTGGTVTVGALTLGRGNNYQNNESGYATVGTGATVTSLGDVILGFAGTGTGSLNLSGGTFNVAGGALGVQVGVYDTAKAFVNITAGSALNLEFNRSIGLDTGVGTTTTGGAVVNQTGGTVKFYADGGATVGGSGALDLQRGTGGPAGESGTYNLYGGTLTVPQIIATGRTATRAFNFSGGSLQAAGPSTAFMAAGVASAANVQAGGALIDTNGYAITIGQALQHDPTSGAPAVDGGLSVSSTVAGGTLTLTGTSTYTGATTIGAKTTLQLGDGTTGDDGTIATTSGVTDNGALVFNRFGSVSSGYAIAGSGSVTKLGVGTQTLTASNGYTGATTVTAGTLAVSGTGSINGTPGIAVASGAKFLQLSSVASTPAITLAGTLDGFGTVGATTVSSGGIVNNGNGTTGVLNLSSLSYLGTATDNLNLASNTSAGLDVLNALTVSGSGPITLNVLLNGGRFAPGTYELIQYGSTNLTPAALSADFNLGSGLTHAQAGSFSLATVGSNKYLDLTVTGSTASGLDRWTGSVSNAWDTTTTNFTDATYGGSILFTPGDAVTFDDTGANTNPVNISAATVLPSSVTFNNSTATYSVSSTGGFGIGNYSTVTPTTVTLNGAGTVTVSTSNTYSGGTTVNAGTLNVNNPAALGTGALTLNGGTLGNTTGATLQLSANNAQNWNGNFAFSSPNQLNMGTGAVALNTSPTITVNGILQEGGVVANGSGGSYGLTLNGSSGSQLVMAGASTFGGNIVVNSGVTYNGSNGGASTTSGSFGNPSIAGRTVTINSGGLVALTNGNELGSATAAAPKLTFIVNAGGTLETAAFNGGGGAGGNNNIFGPITLNGGTFTTGNGYSAAYPAANLLGTVTVTGSTTSQYGSVINTNATNLTGDGASLATAGITFNVSSTGATVADLNVLVPLTNLNGAAGALIKTGAGTMQLDSASNNYTGSTTVNGGTLFVAANAAITNTGGVVVSGGTLNVTNFGTLNVTSGKQLLTGTGAGVSGATYQGGLVESTYTAIGEASSAATNNLSGYYSMGIGATLNGAGGTNGDQELDVGGYYGGTGTFAELDMATGSTINLATANPFFFIDRANYTGGVTGVVNIGGTVQIYNGTNVANAAGLGLVVGYVGTIGNQTSTITVMPGGKFLTPTLTAKLNGAGTVAGNATNQSVLNLDGGTFQTLGFGGTANEANTAFGNAAAVVNLNGGTLVAGNASNSTFLTGLGAVNVYANGGTIDNNGQAITIGQAIAPATGSGVNTSAGAISVTSGGSGYLVPPQVTFSGGGVSGANGATGYATISNGQVTGIVVTNPGTGYTSAPTVALTTPTGTSGSGATLGSNTAPVVTNTSGTLTFQGVGTTTLAGANTYTGATAVNAGTLSVTGSIASGAGVTVASGAGLAGSGNGTTTGLIAGPVAALGGSNLSLTAANASTPLTLGSSLTLGTAGTYGPTTEATLRYTLASGNAAEPLNVVGPLTFNTGAYVTVTNALNTNSVFGTYTLATYGSEVGGKQFSLSPTAANVTTLNVGRDTETLTDSGTALTLTINGALVPTVAYFDGQVSGKWNDLSNASLVNFSTNLAGTTDAGNVPGAVTDVILNATNAPAALASNQTLGTSTTINSLNVNGNGTSTLAADGSTLTILALADSNADTGGGYTGNAAGNGISIAAAANAFTVNTPIAISTTGANQTWTNKSANLFTAGGTVTGSAGTGGTQTLTLVNTGAGGTTLGGAIGNGANGGALALVVANTGAGLTTLSGTDTYTGATTVAGGSLLVASAGSITATPTITVGSVAATPAALYQAGAVTNTNAGAGGITIGNVPGAFGYYNLSGGAVLNVAGEIDPGGSGGGAGTFGQLDVASGATINLPSSSIPYFLPDRGLTGEASVSNIAGTVQILGGAAPANTTLNGLGVGLNAAVGNLTSTVTILGSGQFLTPSLTVKLNDTNFGATNGGNASNASVLNLNGGLLQTLGFGAAVNQAAASVGTGNAYAVVNFNGGTVKAGTAANSTFMTGLGAVYLNANGGTIDNNGQAITIGQAIASPTGYGVATVPVASGGSGYVVPPQVTFTSGGGTGATGYATISGGAVTGIVITNPGTGYGAAGPTPALVANGSTTAATLGTPTTAINASGALKFQGIGTTTLTGANTYIGGTIVNAGTLLVTGSSTTLTVGNTGRTGTGDVVVNGASSTAFGTLGGTGTAGNTSTGAGAAPGTGVVTVNGYGTITAGASNTATGTLTTGAESWNSSTGQYLAKVIDASNTSTGTAGNDRLVMSALTITSGFAVDVNISSGTLTTLASSPGTVLVLANDTDPNGTTNPFNKGGAAPAGLNLHINGDANASAADQGLTLATQADTLAAGGSDSGYDLVLEAAAAPEPTSLLLAGVVAAPLVLGRRRRRCGPARVG